MGTKANDKVLEKIGDDEPIFVLRAQDLLAPAIVKIWAEIAQLHGLSYERWGEAIVLAEQMEEWPTRKYPD